MSSQTILISINSELRTYPITHKPKAQTPPLNINLKSRLETGFERHLRKPINSCLNDLAMMSLMLGSFKAKLKLHTKAQQFTKNPLYNSINMLNMQLLIQTNCLVNP